jgi:hypothetical protein
MLQKLCCKYIKALQKQTSKISIPHISDDMDSFNNDIVIRFASYLCSRDLVNLSLTCRRFGSNVDGSSLMEDTAKQLVCNAKQDERDALPRMADQSYIELYSELEQLRAPRIFDQLIGEDLYYGNNNKSHVKCDSRYDSTCTALCDHVMRAGKHYAKFIIGASISIGIIRPLKNREKEDLYSFDPWNKSNQMLEEWDRWGDNINYCSYLASTYSEPGCCYWTSRKEREYREWDGSESLEPDDEIGMLLDLEAGTISVYRNGRLLGMMKDGLAGEYCWTITMWSNCERSVRIEKVSIPTDLA